MLLPLLVLSAEDYYKLLGVERSASDRELKKAYRNLSKKYHPDKNPNNDDAKQKFVEVSDAYEALSNAETRKIYDQYGHEGLERHKNNHGRGGGHDPFDLFSRFFGGGGHFGGQGERRGQNMEVTVSLPLKDFYSGIETEFSIEKQMICDTCSGSGSRDGKLDTCGTCAGRGMVVQKAQLAPGIFQQIQTQCPKCGGQGRMIKNPCKTCGGHKVVRGTETYKLEVERGMWKGYKAVYENEADESPDFVAGDLLVTLNEMVPKRWQEDDYRTDGSFFRRKGDNLFWREVLSLREAWMGDWTRNVTHLDGHVVQLSRKRGEVVQPGTTEAIKDEGMPMYEQDPEKRLEGLKFGVLYVDYVVVLPDQMEKGMEKDFYNIWDKWRSKNGVDLGKDANRPPPKLHASRDEL